MKKLDLLVMLYGSLGAGALTAWLGFALASEQTASLVLTGAVVAGLGSATAVLSLVHGLYSALPREHATLSPDLAAGLLLVPVFNLYWVFRVFPGFASAYNAWVEERSIAPVDERVFRAYAVAAVLSAVPYVGYVAAPVALALLGVVVSQGVDAVSRLEDVG